VDFCVIMTVWNFNEWIERVVGRARDFFDHVIVLDTGSEDGSLDTLRRLEGEGAIELYSYRKERGAGRDGNFLLRRADVYRPRWIVKLDHDEYYEDSLHDELERIRTLPERYGWVTSRRVTLWRGKDVHRVDGRYRWFRENTMFRWREGLTYPRDAVHHMERVPEPLRRLGRYRTRSRLIHLSQMDADRVRMQIERLKQFDRDWSAQLEGGDVTLRPFRERMRKRR
jgi:glycosyltransferase involved in cell wall biosynthesis